jgi:hypothetical protein
MPRDTLEPRTEGTTMTARSDDDFDPRFDPAFQRGFEKTSAASPNQRAFEGDDRRSAPHRVADARPVEARPVGYATATAPATAPAPAIGLPPAVDGNAPARTEPRPTDAAALDEQPPRPNPFLIALGVVAVALVAAGVWGIQAAREPFLGTDVASDVDYVGLQILQMIAPVSVALGVATGIGILFVFAVGWQKRR